MKINCPAVIIKRKDNAGYVYLDQEQVIGAVGQTLHGWRYDLFLKRDPRWYSKRTDVKAGSACKTQNIATRNIEKAILKWYRIYGIGKVPAILMEI